MGNIEISVVMGVFNPENEEQLFQSVTSIINQSFQKWELFIYNDGSLEQYEKLFQKISYMDKRIIYIRSVENKGLSYALNQCIKKANGRYIARMDGDDISVPRRLDTLYQFLETHSEYQWVGSNAELIDTEGAWGCEKMQKVPRTQDFLRYSPYIHPAVMFRKEILEQSQGYCVSELTRRCEDYELFMRLHRAGYQGYNIQENLLLYREDEKGYQRRLYRYYIREMLIRYQGFRGLGLLKMKNMPYVLRPLLAGLIPSKIILYIKGLREKEYERS